MSAREAGPRIQRRGRLCALGFILLTGCAGTPPVQPVQADSAVAACDQRLAAEGADLSSVAGKLRRENCLEAMKLKPRLAGFAPGVVEATLRFAECKAEARGRNLPLVDHQNALFACARLQGGPTGEACLTEMVFAKVPVDAMEGAFGACLQMRQGAAR